jgi:hypothetical protein
MEDTDPVRVKLRALLIAWHGVFQSRPTTCAEAVARANETQHDGTGMETPINPVLYETLNEFFSDAKSTKVSTEQLGNFLKKHQRRIECGVRFEASGKRGPRAVWRVIVVDQNRFEHSSDNGSLGNN